MLYFKVHDKADSPSDIIFIFLTWEITGKNSGTDQFDENWLKFNFQVFFDTIWAILRVWENGL